MIPRTKRLAKKTGFNSGIFVISGPGGVGKTTLLKELFRKKQIQKNFIKGITVTTRKRRIGERNGRDYFFVKRKDFLQLKKKKFFLEYQKVLDNYYGTPRFFYELARREGKNLILCIDVKGGIYLKNNFKAAKIVTIFIAAPHEELYRRMQKRREAKHIMQRRLRLAKKELRCARYYDHCVTNADKRQALRKIEAFMLMPRKALDFAI